jgi:UDP:flavonoid glycosyltransferase YjiC (YdhE family)
VRILLATHGTRGDVQPVLALAIALRARGHDVRLLTPSNFVDWVRGHGFPCESDGVDVEEVLRRPDVDINSFRWQMRYFRMLAPQLFRAVSRASADADLIVGAGVQVAGGWVVDVRGVPYVNAVFCPCAVPSSLPPAIRAQTLPAWVNRLCWRLGLPLIDAALRGPVNAGRAELGLAPIASPTAMLFQCPTIVAADSELAPLPPDAPPAAVQTDAWILENPANNIALDPALDAFLGEGSPPIYIGFGSMIATGLDRLVSSLARVTATCRCRMIVAGGWARLHGLMSSSGDVLVIDQAPHQTLFPRVAAVVHHGGAGTTTAAARAGVPQVILPHLLDQFYWARRIEVLGLGPKSLPVRRVTANALGHRLGRVLDDARYRKRAHEVGARIAGRSGVHAAVDYLEEIRARCRA